MLDREPEELQFLGVGGILVEAIKILRACGRLLGLITATFILPLSFALLGHTLITDPLINKIRRNEFIFEHQIGTPAADRTMAVLSSEWSRLIFYEVSYLVFLLVFSLLSTAAVVYTVACAYTAKSVTISKVLSVIPRVWKRLMITFLWYFLIIVVYNIVAVLAFVILVWIFGTNNLGFGIGVTILLVFLFTAHVYISAVWHLGSVISVLEERYGMEAIKKAMNLIQGKRIVAFVLVFGYFLVNAVIQGAFTQAVVHGGPSLGSRISWGIVLVGAMVVVNLVGLLVQSVVYYVCKSYHHQNIDKSALSDHLEEYLGDYMPLKSSIQMESLDV
eukprot:TRINITY_DN29697_c0_g1_i1.p1 TRINITY_DN29697_c0_g1~~TRINITY_DN29697_c0_g1_i1.p1  ORF type:complete len:332 (+),score=15.82 TRINITY_DN29697_c0_g1_i1:207-1202(+)